MKLAKLFLGVVLVYGIVWRSLPGVDKLFYWRDDWVFLWSNKNNPPILYNEIGGPAWWIKSGLFHPAYARMFGKIPVETLQFSGVVIKTINSFVVGLLVYSLVRKKLPAFLAMLLFASYGGAAEAYTWHRITGVAMGFATLAFAFHNFFLSSTKKIYLVGVLAASVVALFSYFGRVVGIFPLFIFSTSLTMYERFKKEYLVYSLFLILLFLGLFAFTRTSINAASGSVVAETILSEISDYKNIKVYFSNLGNLAQSSFVKLPELGGLIGSISPLSLFIGCGLFALWIISILVFAITRSKFFKLVAICLAWLFLTYFPNWMYAGGGPGTMIGSAHRYFAVSAIFFPLIAGIVFSRISKTSQIVLFIILLALSLNYSRYLLDKEKYLRDSGKVLKVYREIVRETETDPLPRLIVIDTQLDYLATGWFPYAYGYYKGIRERENFPPVFANLDAAIKWLCAPSLEDREALGSMYGVPSYQKDRPVLAENIYAWRFSKEGELSNLTSSLRDHLKQCN
ncbi:MAG: hypothetical protein G01um101416_86 [Microgenomates group bacterium Gr01-1014_16]|nr:MAG: hypothetical protein G01um101416_86 [Microgenomates group bacterium Gr01-1014_16]